MIRFCEKVLTKQLQLWQCEVNLIKDNRLMQQIHINDSDELLVKAQELDCKQSHRGKACS